MFRLTEKLPEWQELIPAAGDTPAVRVQFAPVGVKAMRHVRRAVAEILRGESADAMEDAGDAFTREMIRAGILAWEGIGDADGEPIAVSPASIEMFLAEPKLVEAADRVYVMPWVERDREKNVSSGSPSGTSVRATPESGTASSAATPDASADANLTPPPAGEVAPISSTSRRRTRGRKPGK